jgi:hypothetical protein
MSAADDEAGTESWASGSRTSFGHACESTSAQVPKNDLEPSRLSENSKQKETMRTCEKESANSINEGKEKTKNQSKTQNKVKKGNSPKRYFATKDLIILEYNQRCSKLAKGKRKFLSISSVSVTRNKTLLHGATFEETQVGSNCCY